MMPLWIKLLGTRLIKAVAPTLTIHIPYSKIVASLFTLIVPVYIFNLDLIIRIFFFSSSLD